MENNNTNNSTPKMQIEYTTSWVDKLLLGSLVAVGTVATAFNIYTYFKGDDNTSSSNTVTE